MVANNSSSNYNKNSNKYADTIAMSLKFIVNVVHIRVDLTMPVLIYMSFEVHIPRQGAPYSKQCPYQVSFE